MKKFSSLSGYLLKAVLVFGLLVAAAIVGVGVAGFVAYRQVSVSPARPQPSPRAVKPTPTVEDVVPRTVALADIGTWEGQAIMMDVSASLAANRFIAAASTDQPQYTYADYQPNAPRSTSDVPPSLEPSAVGNASVPFPARPVLSDPGSRYIVNPNTGLVVGIDGTTGARAEARQEQEIQHRAATATAARREREARAALPVDAPVESGLPPPKPNMFPAIRRAEAVNETAPDADTAVPSRGFNAAAELTDDRPVFRAQPVTISQPVRTQRRVFALP